ncbi:hypothetical protein [Acinetobacter indicus]|uniref:hypothetical protein n=1 Tax=Acinetobacter indicus TaxID=756892 RepID=UPI001443C8A1|nr:hypothetical protein [Acinetobacter indicus]
MQQSRFKEDDTHHSLPKDIQITFKREKIDLKILKKESSTDTKYELFHRLNTFGSTLSPQEVRNCLLIMTNKSLYKHIYNLSLDQNGFVAQRFHNYMILKVLIIF